MAIRCGYGLQFLKNNIALGGLSKTQQFYIMNFAEAIEALKQGKRVQRTSWDQDLFVFMQVPSTINREIVPKMQSLPQSVKDEFIRRFNDSQLQIDAIYYDDQFAIVNQSNLITGWSPSPSDILAIDWVDLD